MALWRGVSRVRADLRYEVGGTLVFCVQQDERTSVGSMKTVVLNDV